MILGSSSNARLELLAKIGIFPDDTVHPDVDETPIKKELPRDYVSRLSEEKNHAIGAEQGSFVVTADTTVAVGRRILGKPINLEEAEIFLRLLSGRRHRVLTSLCVGHQGKIYKRLVETKVKMKSLSEFEIESFLKSDQWKNRAGGYGIQGSASYFFPFISGSYTNVIGLPITELISLLVGIGYQLPTSFMMGDL